MLSLKSSKRIQTLNSDTVFDSWSAEKIQNNIKSLKTKAKAYSCELRITRTQIQLVNSRGDYFAAIFDDEYNYTLSAFQPQAMMLMLSLKNSTIITML